MGFCTHCALNFIAEAEQEGVSSGNSEMFVEVQKVTEWWTDLVFSPTHSHQLKIAMKSRKNLTVCRLLKGIVRLRRYPLTLSTGHKSRWYTLVCFQIIVFLLHSPCNNFLTFTPLPI